MSISAVMIDKREPEWVRKLKFGNVPVTEEILETGDLWVVTSDNKILAIERKTTQDFLGSLGDERLFAQASRLAEMRKEGYWPYVMISGHFMNLAGKVYTDRETGWNWNSLEGALLSLQEMGLFVTHCSGDTEFEEAVIRLADRKRDEKMLLPPARLAKVLGLQAGFLCGLPGIGPEKVNHILDYCGSPALALIGLTDDRIPIPGVGPGIRNNVRHTLGLQDNQQFELVLDENNKEIHKPKGEIKIMFENAIVLQEEKRELTVPIWDMIKEMAPMMHQSRLFGVSSVEQAAAIMIKGYEVGFGFAASFDLIQVIQGKPGVSPRGCMALILNSPIIKDVKVERLTDQAGSFTGYKCTMSRSNGFTYSAQFTLDDANRAGLIKKDSGWEKYPENMCLWRAVGFAADVVAPDVTNGLTGLMKMPEQFNIGLTEGGDIIDLQVKPEEPVLSSVEGPVMELPPEPDPSFSLNDLISMYPAEKIMEMNEGRIPGTQEEINQVVMKLAAGTA